MLFATFLRFQPPRFEVSLLLTILSTRTHEHEHGRSKSNEMSYCSNDILKPLEKNSFKLELKHLL